MLLLTLLYIHFMVCDFQNCPKRPEQKAEEERFSSLNK